MTVYAVIKGQKTDFSFSNGDFRWEIVGDNRCFLWKQWFGV